ncbi:MAG: PP2C family protein-serine/threonine phosphatase [Bacteroidota bacterium]
MVRKTFQSLQDFYRLFTSGMTSTEIEKLVSDDAKGMYTFYVRNMPPRQPGESRVARFFRFFWYLFLAFLLKLTPARRLSYAIAIVLVSLAFLDDDLMKAFYGILILNFLLALELADKLVTRDELEFARQIQLSLLPDAIRPVQGFSLASHSEVAASVGGDYYDVLPLDDGSTLVVIADVSGKGISAALYTVKVQTALQLLSKESSNPRELLIRLNEYLYSQLRRNFFLTISIMRLFPNGKVQYSRAGHMPALFFDASRKACSWLQPKGTAIGLAPPEGGNGEPESGAHRIFEKSLESEEFTLKGHDIIVLYTDGVIESTNRVQEEFGQVRLMQMVLDSAGSEPAQVKDRLVERLKLFRNGEELRDDTTFVVFRRNGSRA